MGEEGGGEVTAGRKDSWLFVVVVVDVDISGPSAADTELDSEFEDFARIFCILLLN